MEYQAGYILDNLLKSLADNSLHYNASKELAKWLSHFQLKSATGFKKEVEHSSFISILINILQRGFPTRLNMYALEQLVNSSSILKINQSNELSIDVDIIEGGKDITELIFRSFHIMDPRITRKELKNRYQSSWENLGSKYEEDFLFEDLPNALSSVKDSDFLCQLIATQRSINSILNNNPNISPKGEKLKNNFNEQRTDFSIEFPYNFQNNAKGIVIEVDGQQHLQTEQIYLDTERDKAIAYSDWYNTLRIKTTEFGTVQFSNKLNSVFFKSISNEYIKTCKKNFSNPLWNETLSNEIFQLCLIPFAIARIQRTLLEAIAHNKLSLSEDIWKIAVIERDVPCAAIAIEDLKILVESLNILQKSAFKIPSIELHIFNTKEFEGSVFQKGKFKSIGSFNQQEKFDLIIDIAVLDRGFSSIITANAKEVITVRSIHYREEKRKVLTGDMIKYNPICKVENGVVIDKPRNELINKSLEYLLQSFFRKKSFLEGQLPIIHNALQCKSVIGLLPTGGGKSLTYQLSAILQAGVCLVVDPIRSLMKDQVDGLNKNYIDSCLYINSTLKGDSKRKALENLKEGSVQFVFISPERLQMEDFRLVLDGMFQDKIYFSYCVIDEVHCVSEWGHDFRTAYLRLGENAMRCCKTKNLKHIPLFGLTATASYDVLSDVQRELSGNDTGKKLTEESIIRSEFTKRLELQFIVKEVVFPTSDIKTIWDLKSLLGKAKQEKVKEIIREVPDVLKTFNESPSYIFEEKILKEKELANQLFKKIQVDYDLLDNFWSLKNAALIFCPHKSGIFGVTDKFKVDKDGNPISPRNGYLDIFNNHNGLKAGYFMGSGEEKDEVSISIQEESFDNQDKFINSELNLMVATKAFGMGIDKENIRYTIHINYPASIESYVQEAGRAGRDRKLALSYILYNDQLVQIPKDDKKIEHDLDINLYFHNNSFKGELKELTVLEELLTEVHFPDRTFELENQVNIELEETISTFYKERHGIKCLDIYSENREPLGYINIDSLVGNIGISVNPELSKKIFTVIIEYIKSKELTEPIHHWLLRSDKQIGILDILKKLRINESSKLTVGFYNDTKDRVKTLTKWLQAVIHKFFKEEDVLQMRISSSDADAFIEAICDKYKVFTKGSKLNFIEKCQQRDKSKPNPYIGYALEQFQLLYNGYRDKVDTEKAIYRLSTIGVVDDYTINFSSNTFTLYITKKTEKEFLNHLNNYLLKYYSDITTKIKLQELNSISESNIIKKCLIFLVRFVYENIRNKRMQAISDIKKACKETIQKGENGSIWLKDFIDLYFNSKYARKGYFYTDKNGKIINASIIDLTNEGKNEKIDLVWFFIKATDEDGGSQIDNIKHLRGACIRMSSSILEPMYSVLFLNAFTLYMLEYNNKKYLEEAEELLVNAFSVLQIKERNISDKDLENIYNRFIKEVTARNPSLIIFLKDFDMRLDYNNIMVSKYIPILQKTTKTLNQLNNILNHGNQ